MYYGRYIEGDKNDDGSDFLPYNDEYMEYNSTLKKYTLTESAIVTFLNLNLGLEYENIEVKNYLAEQRDNVYRELLRSAYQPYHRDIVKFKIARMKKGREGIFNAMLSQVKWATRFDKDMDEMGISPNTQADLLEYQLWHKGSYGVMIDPAEFEVGY